MLSCQLLLCGIQVCFSQVCVTVFMCVCGYCWVAGKKKNNSMCLHSDILVPLLYFDVFKMKLPVPSDFVCFKHL